MPITTEASNNVSSLGMWKALAVEIGTVKIRLPWIVVRIAGRKRFDHDHIARFAHTHYELPGKLEK
jgi:hypothetical protein